jgi:NAD(P)-dependent dehydrogenase (short-subunit alcohol dehydrogenase family)
MGAACARELAQRGYRVALMSPSGRAVDLAEQLGGLGIAGSVTEGGDLASLVDGAIDRYGRIDGVVNSTGHPPSGDILDLTDDEWHEALEMVVLNVVRIARLVTPAMVRQGAAPSSTSLPIRPSSRPPHSPSLPPCAPPWPASPSSIRTATRRKASG